MDQPDGQPKLTDTDLQRRREAARRWAESDTWDAATTMLLVEAVGDDDEEVRNWATEALERLGAPAAETLPELQARLSSTHADTSYWAATLLGRLGPAGTPAVKMLLQTLANSTHSSVRERAVWALGQMGPAAREALPQLRQIAAEDAGRISRLAHSACVSIET